jgi:hypothetical protein
MAHLQIETLALALNRKALQKALQNTPTTLDAMYDLTLKRISEIHSPIAFRMFAWVLLSECPLTIEELQCAVALTDPTAIDEDDLVDESILLSVCAGLLTVKIGEVWPRRGQRIVNFIREYSMEHSSL